MNDPRSGAIFLAGFALWLLLHPYWGIWHDARLYSVMALHWLMPQNYARDPWFVYGTQDGISLFTPLFARLVAWLGLGEAARLVSLLGGFVYALASWTLVRVARPGRFGALAFLLLMSFPLAYCPNDWGITRLAEAFPTPRPFAVAASLAALTFQLRGRVGWAWGFHGLALLLHPLMAIGAVALGLGARLQEKLAVLAIGLAPLAVIALILAGVPRFQAMDGHWFDLVAQTAVIVMMPGRDYDQTLLVLAAALLLLAAQFGEARLRRYYVLALIVGFLGLAVTLLASSFYPSALVLQVQPWRALWLTLVFAVIAVCDLAGQWPGATRHGRVGLLLAATALLWVEYGGGYGLLAVAIALHFARGGLVRCSHALSEVWAYRFGWLVFSVSVISALPGLWLEFEMQGAAQSVWAEVSDGLRGLLVTGGFGLLAFLTWLVLVRLPERTGLLLGLLACGAVLTVWDQRGEFVRALEKRYRPYAPPTYFAGHIRPGEVVYWPGNPEGIWFELHTASYAGSVQAVGIVFSRRHALEMERRLKRTAQVGIADELFADPRLDEAARLASVLRRRYISWPDNLHAMASVQGEINALSRKSLVYLCNDPALDWVIDPMDFPELAMTHEVIPLYKHGKSVDVDHSLYDCRQMRQQAWPAVTHEKSPQVAYP
ncbi:MAG: hypothetical protein CVU17_07940 [Betaproteobacteria bacterium HGW-Betaproteobacteria-11]|nr:MAG: hypothetical protein CVU17_07940 [Betaproteobacteria bacterium HGW-Betaproteobacteria-11]